MCFLVDYVSTEGRYVKFPGAGVVSHLIWVLGTKLAFSAVMHFSSPTFRPFKDYVEV